LDDRVGLTQQPHSTVEGTTQLRQKLIGGFVRGLGLPTFPTILSIVQFILLSTTNTMSFNSHKSWHIHTKGAKERLLAAKSSNQVSESEKQKKIKERDSEFEQEQLQQLKSVNKEENEVSEFRPELPSDAAAVSFLYEPPPMPEEKEKPEECIPDLPENKKARDFLKNAPTKGLWMPLGVEVKVMQCWRCKAYGHRTGDRECPMSVSGNLKSEVFRKAHEDPMTNYIKEQKESKERERRQKLDRVEYFKSVLKGTKKDKKDKKHKKHKNNRDKKKKNKRKSRDSDSDANNHHKKKQKTK